MCRLTQTVFSEIEYGVTLVVDLQEPSKATEPLTSLGGLWVNGSHSGDAVYVTIFIDSNIAMEDSN